MHERSRTGATAGDAALGRHAKSTAPRSTTCSWRRVARKVPSSSSSPGVLPRRRAGRPRDPACGTPAASTRSRPRPGWVSRSTAAARTALSADRVRAPDRIPTIIPGRSPVVVVAVYWRRPEWRRGRRLDASVRVRADPHPARPVREDQINATMRSGKRTTRSLTRGEFECASQNPFAFLPFALGIGVTSASALTVEEAKKQGFIRAATANEVPYSLYMQPDGTSAGIGPDVANAVLKSMGIERSIGPSTPFGTLIPGLKARRFDFAAAEQNISPERCKQVAFTEPNSSYGEGLLVKKGNPKGLTTYGDIAKDPSLKVAVVSGANNVDFLRAVGVKDEQIVFIPANADAIPTVRSRVDAYAATELTVSELAKDRPMSSRSRHSRIRSSRRTGPQLWRLCLPSGRRGIARRVQHCARRVPKDGRLQEDPHEVWSVGTRASRQRQRRTSPISAPGSNKKGARSRTGRDLLSFGEIAR